MIFFVMIAVACGFLALFLGFLSIYLAAGFNIYIMDLWHMREVIGGLLIVGLVFGLIAIIQALYKDLMK